MRSINSAFVKAGRRPPRSGLALTTPSESTLGGKQSGTAVPSLTAWRRLGARSSPPPVPLPLWNRALIHRRERPPTHHLDAVRRESNALRASATPAPRECKKFQFFAQKSNALRVSAALESRHFINPCIINHLVVLVP